MENILPSHADRIGIARLEKRAGKYAGGSPSRGPPRRPPYRKEPSNDGDTSLCASRVAAWLEYVTPLRRHSLGGLVIPLRFPQQLLIFDA